MLNALLLGGVLQEPGAAALFLEAAEYHKVPVAKLDDAAVTVYLKSAIVESTKLSDGTLLSSYKKPFGDIRWGVNLWSMSFDQLPPVYSVTHIMKTHVDALDFEGCQLHAKSIVGNVFRYETEREGQLKGFLQNSGNSACTFNVLFSEVLGDDVCTEEAVCVKLDPGGKYTLDALECDENEHGFGVFSIFDEKMTMEVFRFEYYKEEKLA